MEIIISYRGIDRLIQGPFKIWGTQRDLRKLNTSLTAAFQFDWELGWVEVSDEGKQNAKTGPISWEKGAPGAPTPPLDHDTATPGNIKLSNQ